MGYTCKAHRQALAAEAAGEAASRKERAAEGKAARKAAREAEEAKKAEQQTREIHLHYWTNLSIPNTLIEDGMRSNVLPTINDMEEEIFRRMREYNCLEVTELRAVFDFSRWFKPVMHSCTHRICPSRWPQWIVCRHEPIPFHT